MSWLPNPFKSLESFSDDANGASSVKEDLSEIGETITRQLRGVAAFLAPPPASPSSPDDSNDSGSPSFAKIKNDLVELGGSLKSSLSLLSTNETVSGFSKMASDFLQLDEVGEEEGEEEEGDRGVGVTDSVLHFVNEISHRPECWTDFPLSLNYDFIMSHNQAEHVAVIVDLVPSLAELRARLSREMKADRFWMIYFILLLPRLNRDSVDLLSTPEIVETRSAMLNMLLNNRNTQTTESEKDHSDNPSQSDSRLGNDIQDLNSYVEKTIVVDKPSEEGDNTAVSSSSMHQANGSG